jgi:hypothetical protein
MSPTKQGVAVNTAEPIIITNSGLFFDLSGEVSHTGTALMLGESDRLR